jgi:hypothetical protein
MDILQWIITTIVEIVGIVAGRIWERFATAQANPSLAFIK